MLLVEIDHLGIAVEDLDAAIDWYVKTFGATVEHRRAYPSESTEEAMLRVAESWVQLLTPHGDRGSIKWHLRKKGPGLHHVAYRVADCAEALEAVKAQGYEPIDEVPRPGSRNTAVAFLRDPLGVLVELVQVSAHEAATGEPDWEMDPEVEEALIARRQRSRP